MTSNGRKPATPSRPADHLLAGHVVPLHLTKRQQAYCRRAVGITRFVYNLCVATHQLCRANQLQWPSWQDLNKAVNESKQHDFPFLKEVSYRVVDGAVMNFGNAVKNWLDPDLKAKKPKFHKNASPAQDPSAPLAQYARSTTTANAASNYPTWAP